MKTHENQGDIQVIVVSLLEFPVVLLHFSLKPVVEIHSGVDASFSATKHGLQGTPENFLQSIVV